MEVTAALPGKWRIKGNKGKGASSKGFQIHYC